MARILLGVSGGIAAYKALELARLATLAGHGVRVLMTETATRFVGPASFEGIVGAPVLRSEFERDPLRGAFPGEEQLGHDPIGHIGAVLYTKYVYFFEVAGLVLLVAMIGAIVLTLRHKVRVRRQSIVRQVSRTPEMSIEIVKVRSGQGLGGTP